MRRQKADQSNASQVMHTKKIAQTITGNAFNSAVGFLCLLIIQNFASINTTESYIRIINYTLIILPLIEFGISTYTTSTPTITRATIRLQIWLFTISIAGLFYLSKSTVLANEILLVCAGLYGTRLAALRYQRTQNWLAFNVANSVQNLTRLLAIAGLLAIDYENKLTIAIAFTSVATGVLSFVVSKNQTLEYSDNKNIDWSFSKHYAIGCIIALAMRLDLIIIDNLLSDKDFIAYGLILQISLIFPIITNALMAVYLVNNAKQPITKHPLMAISALIIASPLIYYVVNITLKHLFNLNSIEYTLCGVALIACGLGGIYYTPHEANLYKSDPTKILILKIIQTAIIAASYPIIKIGIGESTIIVAGFVLLSRIYAWSYLYANQRNTQNTSQRLQA